MGLSTVSLTILSKCGCRGDPEHSVGQPYCYISGARQTDVVGVADDHSIYEGQIDDLARCRRIAFRSLTSASVQLWSYDVFSAHTAKETGDVLSDQTGSSNMVMPLCPSILEGNSAGYVRLRKSCTDHCAHRQASLRVLSKSP